MKLILALLGGCLGLAAWSLYLLDQGAEAAAGYAQQISTLTRALDERDAILRAPAVCPTGSCSGCVDTAARAHYVVELNKAAAVQVATQSEVERCKEALYSCLDDAARAKADLNACEVGRAGGL